MSHDNKFVAGIFKDDLSFDYIEGLKFIIDHLGYSQDQFDIFFKNKNEFLLDVKKELEELDLDLAYLKKEREVYLDMRDNTEFVMYMNRVFEIERERKLAKKSLSTSTSDKSSLYKLRGSRELQDWSAESKEVAFVKLNRIGNLEYKAKVRIKRLTSILQKIESRKEEDFEILGGKLDNSWCLVMEAINKLVGMNRAFFIDQELF